VKEAEDNGSILRTGALTEAEEVAARELLESPNLMDRIADDFQTCGVVGIPFPSFVKPRWGMCVIGDRNPGWRSAATRLRLPWAMGCNAFGVKNGLGRDGLFTAPRLYSKAQGRAAHPEGASPGSGLVFGFQREEKRAILSWGLRSGPFSPDPYECCYWQLIRPAKVAQYSCQVCGTSVRLVFWAHDKESRMILGIKPTFYWEPEKKVARKASGSGS
jgi:hypothetical protein